MTGRKEPEEHLRLHRAPPGLLARALVSEERRAERRRVALASALIALLLGWGGGWLHHGLTRAPPPVTASRAGELPAEVALASAQAGEATYVLDIRVPEAARVEVAGSWDGWRPTPMVQRDGTFFTVLHLPPGRYEYMFVIDGERWVPDPDAPLTRDDGFGLRNSVLAI